MTDLNELRGAFEAILFATGEALSRVRISAVLDCSEDEVDIMAASLRDELAFGRRGIRLIELQNCYQLVSSAEFSDYVRHALEVRKPPQLSASAMETLAIIAYHQPATKAYVEQVRGVDSSYSVSLLLDRGLIEPAGRLPVPGRPILYQTTLEFLRCFGIKSLEELPEMPEAEQDNEGQVKMQEILGMIEAREAETSTVSDDDSQNGETGSPAAPEE